MKSDELKNLSYSRKFSLFFFGFCNIFILFFFYFMGVFPVINKICLMIRLNLSQIVYLKIAESKNCLTFQFKNNQDF